MENTTQIRLNYYSTSNEKYHPLVLEIEKKINIHKEGYSSFLLFHEDFNVFIDLYIGHKGINWYILMRDSSFWSHEVLTKYNYFWNWDNLIENDEIKWTSDFIKQNVEFVSFEKIVNGINFE